jgi:lipopolysaccharide export system permease protein
MQNGTIQRRPKQVGDMSIVRFQSYAFDLVQPDPGGK